MKFTDSQEKAIEHAGLNLQLIACAGSGKTEVVARRVVHLLTPGRPDSLEPANIVAFTFTDKAATELKERTITRTREALTETKSPQLSILPSQIGVGFIVIAYRVPNPAKTSRKLLRPASRSSMISSARSSGSGRLSRSVRLLSLSQKMSRLVLSRALRSS